MNFDLKKPCADCPFRSDKLFQLRPDRVKEIVNGDSFPCHKTVDYSEGTPDTSKEQECAGLMIMLEHMEQPNQMMRIAERLGVYDRTKLDMDSPVYEHVEDYLDCLEESSEC